MNKLRLIIFLVVALAQISVPASMIWKRQRTLREGRLWKFRTAPVDPVDAMRGRYLVPCVSRRRNFRSAKPLALSGHRLRQTKGRRGWLCRGRSSRRDTHWRDDDVVKAESLELLR